MRFTRFLSVAIFSATLACTAFAADQTPKQRYFRDKGAVKRPQQFGDGITVVNAASYLPGVSPGGLATVFGTNLTDVNGVIAAGTNPFPLTLADVSVTVNGVPAPIFSVSYSNGQDQISFEVPWGTDLGTGAAYVQVFDYGQQVGAQRVDSFTEDPGIFSYQKYGQLYAVATHGRDNTLISPDNPAERGEIVILYTTGLGPVDRRIPDGFGAPSDPPAVTLDPFRVVVAGEDVRVLFSGLAPGFVGVYQINMVLPGDLPAGDLTIKILSDYADSETAYITVR